MTTEWFDPIWIESKLKLDWNWREIAKALNKPKSTVNDRYRFWKARLHKENSIVIEQRKLRPTVTKQKKRIAIESIVS